MRSGKIPEERTYKITCDECGYSEEVSSAQLTYKEGKTCPRCYKGKMYWVPPAEEARRRELGGRYGQGGRTMPEEERRIPPAVLMIPVGLGLAAVVGIAAIAMAAPPPEEYICPHCGAAFATEEELNEHIQTEHPLIEFWVNNLVISPQEVNLGQVVTISCTVTNIGVEAGDYTILLGGDFMAEQIVELAPGESKTIAFEVVPTEIKTHSVSVDGLTGTFNVIGVADIRVENLVISPAEIIIGEVVTISCTATNYGTAAGSRVITCLVS